MQLDKTKGYIFRVVDVEQAKAVVEVLVRQGYKVQGGGWGEYDYEQAVIYNIVVDPKEVDDYVCYNPHKAIKNIYTWVDTLMFLPYNLPLEVKETIQVGDTIFDKEEFELAVSKLKGVKA